MGLPYVISKHELERTFSELVKSIEGGGIAGRSVRLAATRKSDGAHVDIVVVVPSTKPRRYEDAWRLAWDALHRAGVEAPDSNWGRVLVTIQHAAVLLSGINALSPVALGALRDRLAALLRVAKSAGIETPDLVDITSSGVGGTLMEIVKQVLAFFLKNPGELIARIVKFVAEGGFEKLGIKGPQGVYLFLAGKKTYIGLLFGLAYGALAYLCSSGTALPFDACTYSNWVFNASVVMVSIGLLDASVRAQPPSR